MSSQPTARPAPQRHALGLPAGSIRAVLALAVLGFLWLVAYRTVEKGPDARLPVEFVYLQFLMVMILAHYFSAHGSTIGQAVSEKSPLGLPRGTVRLLLLAGYAGLAYYLYNNRRPFDVPQTEGFFMPLALMLSGYFIGHYLTGAVRLFSGGRLPFWFQDFQAWAALLAICGLGILVMIHFVINPTVTEEQQVQPHMLDMVLAAIVGFYFGSRS